MASETITVKLELSEEVKEAIRRAEARAATEQPMRVMPDGDAPEHVLKYRATLIATNYTWICGWCDQVNAVDEIVLHVRCNNCGEQVAVKTAEHKINW